MKDGTLYIVSTPIGNLEDLTARASRILGEVDAVLAEDTRRTGILLRHLGLGTPMISLHRHNERRREGEILERLREGASFALVSDAGTPLVSDPGEGLVDRVLDAGLGVVPIPGPSAVLAALAASGFPSVPFRFVGFPPRKSGERRAFVEGLRDATETIILFESPERTVRFLEELEEIGEGARDVAVARELTKLHEEVRRGTVGSLAAYYREAPPRGEVTIVLGAAVAAPDESAAVVDDEAALALGRALLSRGFSPSRAAREVARRLGIPRNRAYERMQELERSEGDGEEG